MAMTVSIVVSSRCEAPFRAVPGRYVHKRGENGAAYCTIMRREPALSPSNAMPGWAFVKPAMAFFGARAS